MEGKMINKLSIKTPKQRRAVIALLEQAIPVKDLGAIIGALNPRQVISELRQQGFEEIILTKRFTVIDQDGKRCRPGEYVILQEFKPILEAILKEDDCKVTLRRTSPQQNRNHINHDKRGM